VIGSYFWELPNTEFERLWELLIFDENIKNEVCYSRIDEYFIQFQLLMYAYALLKLSDHGADTDVLSVNRLLLLHGA
jgi:hypothetical protein